MDFITAFHLQCSSRQVLWSRTRLRPLFTPGRNHSDTLQALWAPIYAGTYRYRTRVCGGFRDPSED
eukprot:311729-Rhodomonas_salina.2